jgi:hypothetical protein
MDSALPKRDASLGRGQSPPKAEIEKLLENQDRADKFRQMVVIPALERLAQSFHRVGRETTLVTGHLVVGMIVTHGGIEEFQYIFSIRVTPNSIIASPRTVVINQKTNQRLETKRALREGTQDVDIGTISKEEIMRHFLTEYKRQTAMAV